MPCKLSIIPFVVATSFHSVLKFVSCTIPGDGIPPPHFFDKTGCPAQTYQAKQDLHKFATLAFDVQAFAGKMRNEGYSSPRNVLQYSKAQHCGPTLAVIAFRCERSYCLITLDYRLVETLITINYKRR